MDDKEVIYELGHWSPKYVLDLCGRLIDFYCFKCKRDFKGITAYEHFMTCYPEFIKELRAGKERRLGRVKQKGSDYLRTFGPSEEPQQNLLFPLPVDDPKTVKEVLSGLHVEEAPKPNPKVFREREGFREDPEAQKGD